MSEGYPAKTFKSGNSVALRLPKALGLKEGMDMKVREERGRFILEPVEKPKRKFDVEKVWGIIPDFPLLSPEDREFEERELDWEGKRLSKDG